MNETTGTAFSYSISIEQKKYILRQAWLHFFFKSCLIILESNVTSSSDMLCIFVSSRVLNGEAPLQEPASSGYTIILQSCWILISSGSSTVTFKPSWQNYMIGYRIQIFSLNVLLPSHGIADYILLMFFTWRTTSKHSMHKVFLFHSLTSRQLHTDIWCYYQINISE